MGIAPLLCKKLNVFVRILLANEQMKERNSTRQIQTKYYSFPFRFSSSVTGDAPNLNVLMLKLRPSYTTSLVRLTYDCGMLYYADEPILAYVSAAFTTSRVLRSGDMEDTQTPIDSIALEEVAFDSTVLQGVDWSSHPLTGTVPNSLT